MDSNTFCPLPWLQLASTTDGFCRPCCEFKWKQSEKTAHWSKDIDLYHTKLESIKNDLLNNKKPIECSRCWNAEHIGIKSLRQSILTNSLFKRDINIGTVSIDLKLGNLCNLGCRMCEPHSSSVLQKEVINNLDLEWTKDDLHAAQIDYNNNNWIDTSLEKISKITTLEHIKFTGGEPFVIPSIKKFLNSIENPKMLSLELLTNGLLINSDKIELLKKFKKVFLHLSCDGIGAAYNYIRWPGKWNDFEKQLDFLITNTNFELSISVTANAYNVYFLPELYEYFDQKNVKMSTIIIVDSPDYLHPWIYNDDIKQKIEEKYKKYLDQRYYKGLEDILNANNIIYNNTLYQTFLKQKEIKDRLRKQTFNPLGDLDAI
jgi:MoaA/NifB/PqqE/SkfB family radical SAM enzyme